MNGRSRQNVVCNLYPENGNGLVNILLDNKPL